MMSVTVDKQVLHADALGLRTVGQVLKHLRRANRIVVNVLIDGKQPDLDRLGSIRKALVANHTLVIKTADPRQMATQVLLEVESQLDEVDRLKNESATLLQRNQVAPAIEKLGGCFKTWQHAQEAILKIAQLLSIDLHRIKVGGRALNELMDECAGQLRQIRTALEGRDFPALTELLLNSMTAQCGQWRDAIKSLRGVIVAR
jgi:hypothetical protein